MPIANIDRALKAIETLAETPGGLSLGILADRLDVPKSAAHRLLQSPAGLGYVLQDASSQDYFLSLKLPLLGFCYLEARRLPVSDAPVAGTISVAGPRVRLNDARITEFAPRLLAATQAVAQLWPLRMRQPAGANGAAMPPTTIQSQSIVSTA